MASSTPPLTATSKPFRSQHYPHHNFNNHHSQSGRHGHSWSSQKFFLNKSTASYNAARTGNPTARPLSRNPNLVSFSSFSSSKSEIGADFCGRRSTRLVSKMHFGRPKAVSGSRHTSIAEEVLDYIIGFRVDDYVGIERVLISFETQLCGSDDYTFLLRELGNKGECSKAMWCFEFAVRRERRRNEQGKLASAMISVLGRLGKVELARKVFDAAAEEGYGNTVYAFSALISAYGRSGCCEEAIRVFDSMRMAGLKPNLVTYNAVIDACGKGGVEFDKTVKIFDEMVRYGVQPDRITFNSLLAVCSRGGLWKAAKDLFNEMICRGIDQDVFTYNTLLDAICKGGQMDLAFEIMSDMAQKNVSPNVVTYSTMIDGYAKCSRFDDALNMFDEMRLAGIRLDRVSYNTLLSIYAKLCLFDEVVNVCKEMECCGIKKDVVTYNALLGGYGKQGKYDEVKRVFEEMNAERVSPNLLTYSTLVDVYAKGCLYKEAMEVFKEFKRAGLRADVVFYSALIDAFCKNGMVECCVYLLNKMTQEGIMPNVVTYNSIIDAFGRSASDEACRSQVEPSASLFNVVNHNAGVDHDDSIAGLFGQLTLEKMYNGRTDKNCRKEILCILDVFRKMHRLDIRPNVVTFSAILNACSRCNSFEDASMLLEELRLFDNRVYGVAHGLLIGNGKSTWAEAQSVFDEVKQIDSPTASAFYNALTDMLWHFGQKRGAQLVVLEGKRRNVWENMWSDSCLDLHLMSSGAARAMVHSWLLSIHSIVYDGRELPNLLSILTGWGKHSKIVGDGALRRAIEALLTGMGAPFRVAKCNLGRFISSGAVVAAWLKEVRTLQLLVLNDNRTCPGNGSVQISNMQALAL